VRGAAAHVRVASMTPSVATTATLLLGVDERDAGLWYVRRALHHIERGYVTELELSREGVNGRTGRRAAPAASPNAAATATPNAPGVNGAAPPHRRPRHGRRDLNPATTRR
jgi:hypothetical protein